MFSSFKYTVCSLIRDPGIVIWSLVFPIVLSTVFMIMFAPIDEMSGFDPIPLAVVEPGDDADGEAFKTFLDAVGDGDAADSDASHEGSSSESASASAPSKATFVSESSESGEQQVLFALTYAPDASEAQRLVEASLETDDAFIGYVELVDGVPNVFIAPQDPVSDRITSIYASIVVSVMDDYLAKSDMVKRIMEDNPAALADPRTLETLSASPEAVERITLTENQPKESVRYYFALLGMASLFGGTVGLVAVTRLQPNLSPLGARRAVSALSHGRAVASTLLACWSVSFACLLAAYLYMRLIVGVDFVGRDPECIAAIAVSALTATALGCAISAIPGIPDGAKSGIMTAIVCFASLFAGLYGQPTMELADRISASAPVLDCINPAVQISQSFHAIMYYDSIAPLLGHLGILLVMAAVFFALASKMLKGARYAGI